MKNLKQGCLPCGSLHLLFKVLLVTAIFKLYPLMTRKVLKLNQAFPGNVGHQNVKAYTIIGHFQVFVGITRITTFGCFLISKVKECTKRDENLNLQ